MDIRSTAVHAGERRKKPPAAVPITTPIHTASSFFYEGLEQLDRVFARQEPGYCYTRYDNPTNSALEELMTALEGGAGSLACASGMAAVEIALLTALNGRPRSILAADALYGATIGVLAKVFEPLGIEVRFVDACDLAAVEAALAAHPPGCVLIETISNPLLRVPEVDRIAEMARASGAALVVDHTFATPLLLKPLDLGANLVVHSATKYLGGHGDALAGIVVSDEPHYETLRMLSRVRGPVLGPFESYLVMRGIKTFPLRMERHCVNACQVADWLARHKTIERVHFPGHATHPDAAVARRIFPAGLSGGMVSFEIRGAARAEIFRFMEGLRMIVPATSLGDVHSMILYPLMSSHREVPPDLRERLGIRDNLVRLSVGIEAIDDILGDLEQALELL